MTEEARELHRIIGATVRDMVALAQLNGGGNPGVTNQPMDVNGLAIGSFSTVLT